MDDVEKSDLFARRLGELIESFSSEYSVTNVGVICAGIGRALGTALANSCMTSGTPHESDQPFVASMIFTIAEAIILKVRIDLNNYTFLDDELKSMNANSALHAADLDSISKQGKRK